MLNKKSGLSYDEVRDRYEYFRARCAKDMVKDISKDLGKELDKGCTEPIHGYKSKCILQIVPQETKCETFQIDSQCAKNMDKVSG